MGSAILHEMLLHARGETVRVFPAMPSSWSDASFYRLRSLNGLMVSAVRRGGKTAFVSLEAVVGGTFKIQVSDWKLAAGDAPKTLPKSFPVEQRSDGTVLQLSPGSSVTLFLGSEQPDLRIDAVADGDAQTHLQLLLCARLTARSLAADPSEANWIGMRSSPTCMSLQCAPFWPYEGDKELCTMPPNLA